MAHTRIGTVIVIILDIGICAVESVLLEFWPGRVWRGYMADVRDQDVTEVFIELDDLALECIGSRGRLRSMRGTAGFRIRGILRLILFRHLDLCIQLLF